MCIISTCVDLWTCRCRYVNIEILGLLIERKTGLWSITDGIVRVILILISGFF